METPVTYFYTDREQTVHAEVGFPEGLLTEFYPPVSELAPAYEDKAVPRVAGGRLSWERVHLVPDGDSAAARGARTHMPDAGSNPYSCARRTDSALVAVETDGATHVDKFLFYRGVGNFTLPIGLTAMDGGRFRFESTGDR